MDDVHVVVGQPLAVRGGGNASASTTSFASEEEGRALLHEMYADPDAFVTHFGNLTETGMLDELLQVFTPEQVTLLNRVIDPRVKEIHSSLARRNCLGSPVSFADGHRARHRVPKANPANAGS